MVAALAIALSPSTDPPDAVPSTPSAAAPGVAPTVDARLVDRPLGACLAGPPLFTDERFPAIPCDAAEAVVRFEGLVILSGATDAPPDTSLALREASALCLDRFPDLGAHGSTSSTLWVVVPSPGAWTGQQARFAMCTHRL